MNGPIEPASDFRELAATIRQMFIALVQQGFSGPEALVIVGHMLNNIRPGDQ